MKKRGYFLFIAIGLLNVANAQWKQMGGTVNGTIKAISVSGNNIFAGTDKGVFLMNDTGTTWSAVNKGLTNSNISSITISGSNIFVGTTQGVFLSTNNGASWSSVKKGLTDTIVFSLAASGNSIFAGTFGDVFLSTNNGASWSATKTGVAYAQFYSIATSSNKVIAGTTANGIVSSTNNGSNWTLLNKGLMGKEVLSVAISGNNLFAATMNGVFLSTNNGSWTAVNKGLTDTLVVSLTSIENYIFAGTGGGGVFLSTNQGASWSAVNAGLTDLGIVSLMISGNNIYAGSGTNVWMRSLSDITNICPAGYTVKTDSATNTATFQDTSKINVTSRYWDFGDGQSSNQKNPVHKYIEGGIYQVCLSSYDNASGCQSQICKDVKLGLPGCKANFTYVSDVKNNVLFTDNSTGNVNIRYWKFGDGAFSTLKNPSHTFSAPGYYSVVYIIQDTILNRFSESDQIIVVGNPIVDCKADFIFNIDFASQNVVFFNQSITANDANYNWDFGDNSLDQNINSLHRYQKVRHYTVCLTIQDMVSHCKDFQCKNVSIDSVASNNLFANFIYSLDATGMKAYFKDQSTGNNNSRMWDFGDGKTDTSKNPVHHYANIGFYNVHLRVRNTVSKAFDDYLAVINIGVTQKHLKASLGYVTDTIYNGKGIFPVDFKGANYGDASSFKIDFGDGTFDSTSTSPEHIYPKDGKYICCYTVYNAKLAETDTQCDTVIVKLTGINEMSNPLNAYHIYPNPANSIITIDGATLQNALLSIYNTIGELILQKPLSNGKNEMDVSNLSKGVYIIKIENLQGVIQQKLIKE